MRLQSTTPSKAPGEFDKTKFPWLGVSTNNGVIVLFTGGSAIGPDQITGVVLHVGKSGRWVGDTSDAFNMNYFMPYYGSVTIEGKP